MKPGPTPTPTEILKLRGSDRARLRSQASGEPYDEVALPACPEWLDDDGRAEWKRLAPLLKQRGTASKVSAGILAILCQNWSLFLKATQRVRSLLVADQTDTMELRRWVAIQSDAAKVYIKASGEFGMSPASKARVRAAKAEMVGDGSKNRFFRKDPP